MYVYDRSLAFFEEVSSTLPFGRIRRLLFFVKHDVCVINRSARQKNLSYVTRCRNANVLLVFRIFNAPKLCFRGDKIM